MTKLHINRCMPKQTPKQIAEYTLRGNWAPTEEIKEALVDSVIKAIKAERANVRKLQAVLNQAADTLKEIDSTCSNAGLEDPFKNGWAWFYKAKATIAQIEKVCP